MLIITGKGINDNTENDIKKNTLDCNEICHFIEVLENKTVLVIFLEWLMKDRLSNSSSISQSVVKGSQKAMPQIWAGSLTKSTVDSAIVECVVNEVEANHGPDVDNDETQKRR